LSIDRPLNVATPLDALSVLVPLNVPLPGFVPIVNTMEAELPVTVLPPASCTVTTGCVANAMPPVELLGLVVKAIFVAAPTVMLKVLLVALVTPPLDAVSVYPLPALSILHPANVATPDVALTGLLVHVNVPPPAFVSIANAIEAVLFVTVLPDASCTVTTGCVVQAVAPLPPPG
jgi:hypothetical protein